MKLCIVKNKFAKKYILIYLHLCKRGANNLASRVF